jgi:APA family basic amino acid/polyamine antiporter
MTARTSQKLEQKLGLLAATAVVLGNIVGVMVFLTPSIAARHLPWDGWYMAAWALGGGLALLGALCLGELGAMMPEAGGDYIFIREAYGDRTAFLSGWTSVVITFPGSIAAMAVGLCYFQAPALLGAWVRDPVLTLGFGAYYYTLSGAQLLGLGVIALLTGVNHLGLRLTGWVQTAITATPLVLVLVAGVAVLFVSPSGPVPPAVATGDKSPWLGLWPAIVPIFFAYAGWNVTTYIGGEIKNPGRNIPRSLILGTGLAVVAYLLVQWVFLNGMPAASMPNAKFVPAEAVTRLFGGWSGQLITLVIALAVMGSLNATVLAGARISYAMSGKGMAFGFLGSQSRRFGTPAAALWIQAALGAVLVMTGRFDELIKYVVGVMLIFSCVTVASVLELRYRRPDLDRPYRVWGYPYTPIAFLLFSGAVLVFLWLESPRELLWGVLITALGLPAYERIRRRRDRKN